MVLVRATQHGVIIQNMTSFPRVGSDKKIGQDVYVKNRPSGCFIPGVIDLTKSSGVMNTSPVSPPLNVAK